MDTKVLSIKKFPAKTFLRLKIESATKGVSMQDFVIDLIQSALKERP